MHTISVQCVALRTYPSILFFITEALIDRLGSSSTAQCSAEAQPTRWRAHPALEELQSPWCGKNPN